LVARATLQNIAFGDSNQEAGTKNQERNIHMTANDIAHQKYAQLMDQVEALEDQITDLESLPATAAARADLPAVQEKLATTRRELQRVSDGCGKPRS